MVKVELVKKIPCIIGEGPHWDDKTQTLLFVDIMKSTVYRWNPVTDEMKSSKVPDSNVGAVVPRKNGGLVVAAHHRFAFFDEDTGETKTIQITEKEGANVRFNDGKCDPVGRFWAGTMGCESEPGVNEKDQGNLYCLDTDLQYKTWRTKIGISNGLSWSSDHKTMYYCDSLEFSIESYDYDIQTGNISNLKTVVKFDRETEGVPDGHCIDTDGNLWVAMFFKGQVIKVYPATGKKEYIKISDEAVKTTSVCWGGSGLDELYVTSARNENASEDDISGSVFKVTGLGAKGLPANVFNG